MVRHDHQRNVWLAAVIGVGLLAPAAVSQEMNKALTSQPGDPRRGKAIAVNSDLGNCSICHAIPIKELSPDAVGDIGPDLAGVGSRLTPAELRQRIVDARQLNPDTLMPAYYVSTGLIRVEKKYAGKAILTAQQVEDLVAYLSSLKEPK